MNLFGIRDFADVIKDFEMRNRVSSDVAFMKDRRDILKPTRKEVFKRVSDWSSGHKQE